MRFIPLAEWQEAGVAGGGREQPIIVEGSIVEVAPEEPVRPLRRPPGDRSRSATWPAETHDEPSADTQRWRAALAEHSRKMPAIWRPPVAPLAPTTTLDTAKGSVGTFTRRHRLRRRLWIALVIISLLVASAGPVINSPVGAWGADVLRATLGPRLTAQIEAIYFDATDALQRLRTHLFGAQNATPWAAPRGTPLPAGTPAVAHRSGSLALMPLPQVQPILSPALPGEGEWSAEGLPDPAYPAWPAPLAKTYLRPDPARPYAVVMLVAIDLRQARLHIVDGTREPAPGGPGAVPAADQAGNLLLAAFNGGFKAADGHYGLMTDGRTYLPPQPGAATLALYADGSVRIGAWGTSAIPTDGLVAYRQNGVPLIANGIVNPTTEINGSSWGAPILANIYTWRSALAVTSSGVLLYAAGNSISADTLAQALVRAGAVDAMQLDINPNWVRFDTYARSGTSLAAHKLRSDMYGGASQFLVPYQRDFLYVTRSEPKGWPKQAPGRANGAYAGP